MPLLQKKHEVFFNTKTKVYRTGAMALRLEKHTLCAQRKKHTLHTGGTTRDARRSTAQNCYFVQLAFVQAGWCLLHAACKGLLCAGHKACVLLQGQVYHPLQHSFLLKQNAHTDETSA